MADRDDRRAPGRADAVRNAAVQAFQSTAGQAGLTRERAQELADELTQAAGRLIGAFEELRPATTDDVRSLREQIASLERRIAALEAAPAAKPPRAAAKPKPKPKPKPKETS
jgi:polyhydroxyalkanoate synthesis regulator phasin